MCLHVKIATLLWVICTIPCVLHTQASWLLTTVKFHLQWYVRNKDVYKVTTLIVYFAFWYRCHKMDWRNFTGHISSVLPMDNFPWKLIVSVLSVWSCNLDETSLLRVTVHISGTKRHLFPLPNLYSRKYQDLLQFSLFWSVNNCNFIHQV